MSLYILLKPLYLKSNKVTFDFQCKKMSAAKIKSRICIIGCGPAGMSALYHFSKLSDENIPELVCYEKQETWGGLWNRTWRTGN